MTCHKILRPVLLSTIFVIVIVNQSGGSSGISIAVSLCRIDDVEQMMITFRLFLWFPFVVSALALMTHSQKDHAFFQCLF